MRSSFNLIAKDEESKVRKDIWKPYIKIYKQEDGFEGMKHKEHGMNISESECTKFRDVISDTIRNLLIPSAEKKVKELIANNTPKKVLFFFSREVQSTGSHGDKLSKTDWELRLAGDLAFVLQDYNTAISNYKRLLERMQKVNNHEEIGSCKEFLTIASLLTENNYKHFKRDMQFVIQCYEKAKSNTLIVRNAIYTTDILKAMRKYTRAGMWMWNTAKLISSEIGVFPLFLEQGAFTIIKNQTQLLRKFSSNLADAGSVYSSQDFTRNAIYCFGTCYFIYRRTQWPEIVINLCLSLARILHKVNLIEQSFIFYKRLMEMSITYHFEGSHLQALMHTAEELTRKVNNCSSTPGDKARVKEILKMNTILKINPQSIEFFTTQDQICCNNKCLLFKDEFDKSQFHDTRVPDKTQKEENIDKVYNNAQSWILIGKIIDGDLSNTYENSLNVKQKLREELLRDLWFYDEKYADRKAVLYCKKKRFVYAIEPILIKFVCKNPLHVPLKLTQLKILCHYLGEATSNEEKKSTLEVQNESITLNPEEQREVILWILPKAEGELVIDGIFWEVDNLVNGMFDISTITGKANSINLIVRQKAGQLQVTTDKDIMLNLLDGEIDSYTLKIKNIGYTSISEIHLQTDYPLILGWKSLSFDWILNPNEEKELKVFVRAKIINEQDKLNPRILIRYCVDKEKSYYRYKRIEHWFSVQKSFVIKEICENSSMKLNEYTVNLQIDKLHVESQKFKIDQLCVVGKEWKVKEKKKSEAFNKVFNRYFSLVQSSESVQLKEKRVVYTENEFTGYDVTLVEPYVNYIKEYEDFMKVKESCFIMVAALWSLEIKGRNVHGFKLVLISSKDKNCRREDTLPLQIVHEAPTTIEHNFDIESLCKVTLKLYIKNISYEPINFRFEGTRGHSDQSDRSLNFLWEGSAIKNFSHIAPQGHCEISLKACMLSSGIYNLNRFMFTFFEEPNTRRSLDPSGFIPQNAIAKTYPLELEQILVKIKDVT